MKASEILREAAKRVYKENLFGGCAAILWQHDTPSDDRERAYGYFKSLFWDGKDDARGAYWFPAEYRNEQRMLSLLLTADMAESVGD